jgi:superfamily II DNA or RNA helicase
MTAQKNTDTSKEIEKINQRLVELEHEQNSLIIKRNTLTQQLTSQDENPEILSVNQKIDLFKKLFKGRTDVFASRWQNSKGRSGYSVACYNEWIKGICNKPKIKCVECSNRKHKALDDQIIYDHLAGKLVVGLYPLLNDNICHLLVADFDKSDWQDSVKAMIQACLQFNIPYAVEISRSGNGAHIWIFFSEPVLAKNARLLGFGLLDKAMEIHPNLSFESYDRLFPNQDIMPEGGFGNLIALPLQYQVRKQGNSQFVDNNLIPYPDQWHFLSHIKSLSSKQIKIILTQLTPSLLITTQEFKAFDNRPPWDQGQKEIRIKIDNCPEQITITLANHIYINLDKTPSLLTARLKRLASFSNPVFFKTQALRFSTNGIPRYITCARIEQGPENSNWLSLPRGCFDEVVTLLEEQKITTAIDDKRQSGKKLSSIKFLGKLRKDQTKAVNIITKHNTGILHAPTAFGKTVAAIGIINKRKVNTLILTHSRQLLDQWQERLKSFLCDVEIGIIGGGKRKPTGQIDIATYQSFINKKDNSIDPLIQEYGQVIIDECHHISAPRFEMVLNEVRAKYVLGLTATPDRQDGHQKIIFMLAGPIRHKVKQNHAAKFEQRVVVTQFYHPPPIHLINSEKRPHISDIYRWLTEDIKRTQRIVGDIISKIEKGCHPLVLTERREHAELINQLLIKNKIQTVILRGAMRVKELKEAKLKLTDTQVVVATGKYVGEGFDLPRLDTLFLALPIAWKGSLAQYVGRIHRDSEGKDRVSVFDYVDSSHPMLERMFRKREKGYKAMGYQITYANKENTL